MTGQSAAGSPCGPVPGSKGAFQETNQEAGVRVGEVRPQGGQASAGHGDLNARFQVTVLPAGSPPAKPTRSGITPEDDPSGGSDPLGGERLEHSRGIRAVVDDGVIRIDRPEPPLGFTVPEMVNHGRMGGQKEQLMGGGKLLEHTGQPLEVPRVEVGGGIVQDDR